MESRWIDLQEPFLEIGATMSEINRKAHNDLYAVLLESRRIGSLRPSGVHLGVSGCEFSVCGGL